MKEALSPFHPFMMRSGSKARSDHGLRAGCFTASHRLWPLKGKQNAFSKSVHTSLLGCGGLGELEQHSIGHSSWRYWTSPFMRSVPESLFESSQRPWPKSWLFHGISPALATLRKAKSQQKCAHLSSDSTAKHLKRRKAGRQRLRPRTLFELCLRETVL